MYLTLGNDGTLRCSHKSIEYVKGKRKRKRKSNNNRDWIGLDIGLDRIGLDRNYTHSEKA